MDSKDYISLCQGENWEISHKSGKYTVIAEGYEVPLSHPVAVHLYIYRVSKEPEVKYQHMKASCFMLWPELRQTWNYWTERRFRKHCGDKKIITYAGGASTGKSHDAAIIALLFWLANPSKRAVLIASTSLESLNSRIFGYVTRYLFEMKIKMPFLYRRGIPPKVLYDVNDQIHGIFAIAAKQGDDDRAIRDIIGRHPKEGMLVVLDESTDMPESLLTALPNLQAGGIWFQLMAIGNSKSVNDLHGALSCPTGGWSSINPLTDTEWETCQKDGICLFFSCYESPAIHETDPSIKAALSKFLVTQEQVEAKKKLYGEESDSFYRFVLGYWRTSGTDDTVVSPVFLNEFKVRELAEWGGIYDLQIVAGLDVAFSTGGDECILRLGVLGHEVHGNIVLDFRGSELIFPIKISAVRGQSYDLQIADQVIEILNKFRCTLDHMAIDATGQGRAIGSVIKLRANSPYDPIKVWSTKLGQLQGKQNDVMIKTSLELYTDIRDFIQTNQLRGVDEETLTQLSTRLIKTENSGKRTLESKAAYRGRMMNINPALAHSPDRADALALCVQAAKISCGFIPGLRRETPIIENFAIQKLLMQEEADKEERVERVVEPPIATFGVDVFDSGVLFDDYTPKY